MNRVALSLVTVPTAVAVPEPIRADWPVRCGCAACAIGR